jgi:uncharacterized protein YaiL (DUF2058 family)
MLDLKAKLLAAGLVTAAQVEKVEKDEAARRQQAKERREAEQRRRVEGGHGPRGRNAERGTDPSAPRSPERQDNRRGGWGGERRGPVAAEHRTDPAHHTAAVEGPARPDARRRDRDDDPDERRARREHSWNEAQRWRKRLDQLKAAGKSEQYEAIRGWVLRDRVDHKQITEAATRFFFARADGTVSHLTVEPDVQQLLINGDVGVVAFMGYNGLEHAVVPRDVADDVAAVRPDWLRHLVGVTDVAATDGAATSPASEEAKPGEDAAHEGDQNQGAPAVVAAAPSAGYGAEGDLGKNEPESDGVDDVADGRGDGRGDGHGETGISEG